METYAFEAQREIKLPVLLSAIPAGFPSPGDDYIDRFLDLNDLVTNPESTFFMRVATDSMSNDGIANGDLIVVDRSANPSDGKVVVGALNGELVIARLAVKNKRYFLVSDNRPFEIHPESDFRIHGVVTYSIKKHI
ncbi:MAG: translesion error-prone DNA polymerase V autoproteolytic subunit [Candidatus Dadabacteria bacterium]|nr:translesion error-prone DNA polymerase V autoproteolytic subunit [Candidatus Dadabacteria bacterium]NIQ14637.1 translesion error-prone DNA polymerase V autoproteolytic subunit [Candidatus Dadabacteria bacterium]